MSILPSIISGSPIALSLAFVDASGATFNGSVVSSMSYSLTDGNANVIVGASLAAPAPSDAAVAVTVAGSHNILPAPFPNADYPSKTDTPVEDVRELAVTVTLTTGALVTLKSFYRIGVGDQNLIVMQNSFQTYAQSLLTASSIPSLGGYPTASEADRVQAMKEAYQRLIRFGYYVRWPRDPDAQNYIDWIYNRMAVIIPRLWLAMTPQRWFSFYPEIFRLSMRRAQVLEADSILKVDPVGAKRDAGIISEKIGEAAVTLQPQRSAASVIGLDRRTLEALKGYIDLRLTLSRN